jgi:hypothetical protein
MLTITPSFVDKDIKTVQFSSDREASQYGSVEVHRSFTISRQDLVCKGAAPSFKTSGFPVKTELFVQNQGGSTSEIKRQSGQTEMPR